MWRSWLARAPGGREVAGSSPVTPTIWRIVARWPLKFHHFMEVFVLLKRFYHHHPVLTRAIGDLSHLLALFLTTTSVIAALQPETTPRVFVSIVSLALFFFALDCIMPHTKHLD